MTLLHPNQCCMFCCTLLYVHSSIAIILLGKRELVALLNLSSWCLVMVERLFLAVPRGCLWFVIVVFPDHTHLLFIMRCFIKGLHFNINRITIKRHRTHRTLTLFEYSQVNCKLKYDYRYDFFSKKCGSYSTLIMAKNP